MTATTEHASLTQPPASPTATQAVVAGLVALAVAMGIGRFAFTPLLPMMLADGVVNLDAASWLASANYLGYLIGALLCTFQPLLWRMLRITQPPNGPALVRGGLAATAVLTLGMALPAPSAWPALRFAAGIASALVFVFASGWCLAQLARLELPSMGALIYIGPGAGIVLSGLAASLMVAWHGSAALGWGVFGVLAAALSAFIWPVFASQAARPGGSPAASSQAAAAPATLERRGEVPLLAGAYGLAGFGYIITATFLPVIARQSMPGSPWLDLFWPIFGVGVMTGAALASRVRGPGDQRLRLAACYFVQALGILVGLWSPTPAGFAIGSLLLGLPFTAITFFALQEVRRLRPASPSGLTGLITALYGLGQIVGPPLATALLARSAGTGRGFAPSLEIAAGALLLGAVVFVSMSRVYPVNVR
ncbi:MAG: YbfB/YjiJ family MFS transporter [Stagnimonas sp.]|nr:YbfB/YjiJ family MFS transporter [Stagnimonas sp.]